MFYIYINRPAVDIGRPPLTLGFDFYVFSGVCGQLETISIPRVTPNLDGWNMKSSH